MISPTEGLGSPAAIEALIGFHCTPEFETDPGTTRDLLNTGVIRSKPGKLGYQTTPLGQAWVQALCQVPAPTEKTVFVDAQGKIRYQYTSLTQPRKGLNASSYRDLLMG